MDLLMITDYWSHTMTILQTLTDLCAIWQKNKNKKQFCKYCLQCLSNERILVEHKETCLKINGKHTAKLRSGSIKFKNYFRQWAVPFKIYGDFEFLLKGVRGSDRNNNVLYTEKYQAHIPCSFAYKVVCGHDKFSKPAVLYKEKNAINRFIKAILEEYGYCKKSDKKAF